MKYSHLILTAASALMFAQASYGMNMKKRRASEKPILKKLLNAEAGKHRDAIMERIKANYLARLNTLFDESLHASRFHRKGTQSESLIEFGKSLERELMQLRSDHLIEIHRFGEIFPFQEIAPIINTFKEQKGLHILPSTKHLKLSKLMELHAIYYALVHSLREIDDWIRHADYEPEDN